MPQKKFHVAEALASNQDVITQMMEGGTDPDNEVLFTSAALLHPISYARKTYTHVTVERFQTSEAPWAHDLKPNELVPFSPVLSCMLLANEDDERGLVTKINYHRFGVEAPFFSDWDVPMAIGGFLRPKTFSVYNGENIITPDGYEPRPLGGHEELGFPAQVAAETIRATGEVVRSIGFEALFAEQQLLAERQRAAGKL